MSIPPEQPQENLPATDSAADMIREAELTAEGLAGHIAAILADPEGAAAMAAASRGQGRPDATEHLAALVEAHARVASASLEGSPCTGLLAEA